MKAEVWDGEHLKSLIVMWHGEHFFDIYDQGRGTMNIF